MGKSEFILNKIRSCILIITILLFNLVIFAKINSYNWFTHIDIYANYPLSFVIENNLDWANNAQYPWMWQRLFYYLLVIIKLITWINYIIINKYFILILNTFIIILIYVIIRPQIQKYRKEVWLSLLALALFTNPYLFRRFISTLRENYWLVLLLAYTLIILKSWFKKGYSLWLLFWAIQITHPISNFFLLFLNWVIWIHYLIKKKYWDISDQLKSVIFWIILWIDGFIWYISSIFWQYKFAATEVVSKNKNNFSYFIINLKHINSIFLILLSSMVAFLIYNIKKISHIYITILIWIIALYLIWFFPSLGLYQDRTLIYIWTYWVILSSFIINKYSRLNITLILSILIINLANFINYPIRIPYEETIKNEYKSIKRLDYTTIALNFDRNPLLQINPNLKINDSLGDEFISNSNKAIQLMNTWNIIIYVSKYTREHIYPNNKSIRELIRNKKTIRLIDESYLFINHWSVN